MKRKDKEKEIAVREHEGEEMRRGKMNETKRDEKTMSEVKRK